jgi:hypothetical protein
VPLCNPGPVGRSDAGFKRLADADEPRWIVGMTLPLREAPWTADHVGPDRLGDQPGDPFRIPPGVFGMSKVIGHAAVTHLEALHSSVPEPRGELRVLATVALECLVESVDPQDILPPDGTVGGGQVCTRTCQAIKPGNAYGMKLLRCSPAEEGDPEITGAIDETLPCWSDVDPGAHDETAATGEPQVVLHETTAHEAVAVQEDQVVAKRCQDAIVSGRCNAKSTILLPGMADGDL